MTTDRLTHEQLEEGRRLLAATAGLTGRDLANQRQRVKAWLYVHSEQLLAAAERELDRSWASL